MAQPADDSPPLRILLVEDSSDDAELIGLALRRGRTLVKLECVDTEPEFLRALGDAPQIVLCDFHLPRFCPRRALQLVGERCPGTPVIVVSRHAEDREIDDLLASGAAGFVRKDRLGELGNAISAALRPRAG